MYEAIKRLKPETVLDLASNTGWFSILAAKLGCQVIALDIDESCMNHLYIEARERQYSILPLVMDINNFTPDIFPFEYEGNERLDSRKSEPLLLSADKRLKCDMVLALALIHHLVLGQNRSLAQIAELFNSFSNKYLVAEFVNKEDKLIKEEPEFFPAYNKNPYNFDWYTMDNLTIELKKYFKRIDIQPSFPDIRKLLICSK